MLASATEHYARQALLASSALIAARRRPAGDAEGVARIVAAFQLAAAQDSIDSFDSMLEEQNIVASPVGVLVPATFAGIASDGRDLVSLLARATTPDDLGRMVVTQVQDMGRTAAAVSVAARPKLGWVRMVRAGACSRCVVQAGKFYRFNRGFLRHPRCGCQHIPSTEALAGDVMTDPQAHFDALSKAEQDRIFTQAGAEAIRLGADIGQVVNARRVTAGMQVAGGSRTTTRLIDGEEFVVNVSLTSPVRRAFGNAYTTEGTTRRSLALQQQAGLRQNGRIQQRLMPESILDGTRSREEAQRLLRLYGYIRDDDAAGLGRDRLQLTRRLERAARARERRAEARA